MKKKATSATAVILLIITYLLIPLLATFIYSLSTSWTGILPKGMTMNNYIELFSDVTFLQSIGRTVLLCIIPISITILFVLLAMFATTLYFPKLDKYIQILCMIPYAIQGVILSVSIISLYAGGSTIISNRLVMLIGAYCIIILPHIYQGIKNSMYSINMPMLVEAAEMLGASKLVAFFKVVIPNILSGITVSALLAVGIVFGDYVLIRNITGSSFENVQIYLFLSMRSSSTRSSAVFVVIMAATLLITLVILRLNAKNNKRLEQKKG